MLRESPTTLGAIVVVSVVLALEFQFLFRNRVGTFPIEGEQPYEVGTLADGQSVRQAFLMQGAGLQGVRVLLKGRLRSRASIHWKLWRGHPDRYDLRMAFEGVEVLEVHPGLQWVGFSFPRDGASSDRWYTVDLALVPHLSGGESSVPPVALVASRDNPDRGGVLWVGDRREPGSLFLRADRFGRTVYRRFQVEAVPNLPGLLQGRLVQWLVFAGWHWALFEFVRSELGTLWTSPRGSVG